MSFPISRHCLNPSIAIFRPSGFSGRFPDPGGKSPQGRTYLLNPGMSKTREQEKRSGKERARGAGPWKAAAELRALFWARGARGYFIPEGTASRGEDAGRAWVLRATGEPTVESTWFCLALFSNSALNQLEEEC